VVKLLLTTFHERRKGSTWGGGKSGGGYQHNVTNFFKKAMTEKCLAEKFSPLLIATMSISSDDSKPHISVLHFSVIAFVQANLTFSSCFNHLDINQNKDKQLENFLIVLPSIVLPFEKLVTLGYQHAITMAGKSFDILRRTRVIPQSFAQTADRDGERFFGENAFTPNRAQNFFLGQILAGVLGEMDQQLHDFVIELEGLAVPDQLIGIRLYQPFMQLKTFM
jgi:hypothetical protein